MASTELAVVRDQNGTAVAGRDIIDGWVAMASDVFKLAGHICDTDFVPDAYRGNAPAVAAAILAGRELGIGPMTSLRHVQIVKGSPSLSAEYKRARVLAAGHEFSILEINTQRCRVRGRRRGSPEPALEIKFDMDDAKRAGLLNPSRSGKPGAWQTRPRRMLFARAGSELCDLLFSDVVNGLATAELLDEGSDDDAFDGYNEADSQEPPKSAARTARRKTPAAEDDTLAAPGRTVAGNEVQPGNGDRTRTGPRAAGAASPRGAQPPPPQDRGLPPLPGEDEQEAPSDEVAEQEAGPAGPAREPPGRHRRLVGVVRAHFRRLGYTDEENELRIAHTAKLAGVTWEPGSTNDLDEDELSKVADTLARCKGRGQLAALLTAMDKAAEGGEGP